MATNDLCTELQKDIKIDVTMVRQWRAEVLAPLIWTWTDPHAYMPAMAPPGATHLRGSAEAARRSVQ